MRAKQNPEAIQLDFGYLEEAQRKWLCQHSRILAFETNDPKRHKQIMAFFIARFPDAEVYLYNRWKGLTRWNQAQADFLAVTHGASGSYDALIANAVEQQYRDLVEALRYLDERLRRTQTVAILEDLEFAREDFKEPLLDALRDWAHDHVLIAHNSVVVLISADLSKVVDELTLDRIVLVRPPLSTETERREIVAKLAQTLQIEIDPITRELLVRETCGLSLHQLECVLRESWVETRGFSRDLVKKYKAEEINHAGFLELEEPRFGFEAIGGYQFVKDLIRTRVVRVLREPERAARFGLSPVRGILFFGPPGTGKTLFARALAKELGIPFVNLRLEALFAAELGASGKLFARAISLAEQMAPCVLFIDEIDRFGRRYEARDSAGEETRRVFNQVLSWLGDKDRRSILVGTTNTPEQLDSAFIRPGRMDCLIPILYPDPEGRRQILEIHLGLKGPATKPPALRLSPQELEALLLDLVRETEGMSGAELEELVRRAKARAFASNRDAILPEDFYHVLGTFRINKEERVSLQMRYLSWWESQSDVPVDYELLSALIPELPSPFSGQVAHT